MVDFLTTNAPGEEKVRIEVPFVIPGGARFNVYITPESYDQKTITIKSDGEDTVVITHDGEIEVKNWKKVKLPAIELRDDPENSVFLEFPININGKERSRFTVQFVIHPDHGLPRAIARLDHREEGSE